MTILSFCGLAGARVVFYGSGGWSAEAIIAFTAFLKSARLLMAQ
jgi:hypothetical protein